MKTTYKAMFRFVEDKLSDYDAYGKKGKTKLAYKRYEHIERVYQYLHRIYDELEVELKKKIDLEALNTATIFHDVGYCLEGNEEHAKRSSDICRGYLLEQGYPLKKIDFICCLISNHSNKELLRNEESPLELVLLLEADLLDDTGAMGIVIDVWSEALKDDATPWSILGHIKEYTHSQMQVNPMRTEPAKRIWEQKKKLTNEFVRQLEMDMKTNLF